MNLGKLYRHGNWGGAGWSNGRAQPSVDYNTVEKAKLPTSKMDRAFREHDQSYAKGQEASGDDALITTLDKMNGIHPWAVKQAFKIKRSLGWKLLKQKKKEEIKKQKHNDIIKSSRAPSFMPPKRKSILRNKSRSKSPRKRNATPVRKRSVSRSRSRSRSRSSSRGRSPRRARFVLTAPKRGRRGRSRTPSVPRPLGLTNTSGVMRPFLKEFGNKDHLTVKFSLPLFSSSKFIPEGSTTKAFHAGDVLALIPLMARGGDIPSNMFTINTEDPAFLYLLPEEIRRKVCSYANFKIKRLGLNVENNTPPISNAFGKGGFGYIPDINRLTDLVEGWDAIETLSQQGGGRYESWPLLQLGSSPVWNPKIETRTARKGGWASTAPTNTTTPSDADLRDTSFGCFVVFCHSDFTVGPGYVNFNIWMHGEVEFSEFYVTQPFPNNILEFTPSSAVFTASRTLGIYNNNACSTPPDNPFDLRMAMALDKNSAIYDNANAYSFDVSKLCGSNGMVMFNLFVAFATTSGALTVELGLSVATGSSFGVLAGTTTSINLTLATALTATHSIIIYPITSPCWVSPYFKNNGISNTCTYHASQVVVSVYPQRLTNVQFNPLGVFNKPKTKSAPPKEKEEIDVDDDDFIEKLLEARRNGRSLKSFTQDFVS